MTYYWLRQLHVATVIFTIGFFVLRFYWMLRRPQLTGKTEVRILSVVNDTLLLAAGLSMAIMSHQYPFTTPWLTAKLVALLIYIVLGTMALRRGRTRRSRTVFGVLAILSVGYIVAVALTRSSTPWISVIY
ncbi:MAG: SirB2 family protein [Gammaproteobacteria bacterium]|nr:SirB2 family protein [Gammaproteobacteria bacterium]